MTEQLKGWDLESGENKKVEFTKFPEGVTIIRLIDAVPNMRWQHWFQRERRGINCPGKGCPICEIRREQKANKETQTHSMTKRFSLQILNKNTNRVEIMEQGITFFEDLKVVLQMAIEDGLDILKVDLSVRRRGMTKDDTTYRIDLGKESKLTEAEERLIEENKVDMNTFHKPTTIEQINNLLSGQDWNTAMGYDEVEENDDEEGFTSIDLSEDNIPFSDGEDFELE